MSIEVEVEQSCLEQLIARVYRDGTWIGYGMADQEAWKAWYLTPKDSEENIRARAHNKWLAKLQAVRKALDGAVQEGVMSQEEADQALQDWLEANPDPDGPAIEVTEEFAIPVKIEQPQDR